MEPVHADNSLSSLPSLGNAPVARGASSNDGRPPVPSRSVETESVAENRRRKSSPFGQWLESWLRDNEATAWMASGLIHMLVVLLLSAVVLERMGAGPDWLLQSVPSDELAVDLDVEISLLESVGEDLSIPSDSLASASIGPSDPLSGTSLPELARSSLPSPDSSTELPILSRMEAIADPLASRGGGMEGRRYENRRRLALEGGGTVASEAAVERGLKWLANHQLANGSWSFKFDSEHCPQCAGRCRNGGVLESTTASTGLALLCFLGAGYTQHEGPYQEVVSKGLYYLIDTMYLTSNGGDLRDLSPLRSGENQAQLILKSGDMYSHGIATLALCEAFAMTKDDNLRDACQEAVKFIVYAQADNGGWRYEPKQPGDTSVTGFQLTALKSAVLGNLHVPREVWYKASDFLDGVEESRGAEYGYLTPSRSHQAMSSVGLFCRMLLGWPRDHQPLVRGAALLAKENPLQNNIYFNYYNSQVLHHIGGKGWEQWNTKMRDYLVATQATEGHEEGSWYFQEAWSDRGGRLYTTTLAILTLEIYYRYMPMYQDEFVDFVP